MSITPDQVRHVALLSRLQLGEDEVERYTKQLDAILGHVEQLNALDTSNVEPMITATVSGNVFRPDEPRPSLTREEALQSAPKSDGEFFVVPKVIE
ncbi:MAG: aspartyl/glutamyl-tRNA(Asn/Gln) amidotransferase subunit C [Planctomycetota bacterium]|nr:Asp-tRNA(Asn)/Glu-tRNA(Gln) amidotransferase subunit GatC [Planctomycetota bacterium]